ncbi:MAG: FAD-dependent oxidoreductase [Bacillota bacterium]
MRVIVIGGVAAGMSAASKMKRLNKDIDLIVYEKGNDLSYGACGMPYFLSDIIKEEVALIARTKTQFENNGIRVEVMHEVTDIDPSRKMIKGVNLDTNEPFKDTYDKLIIATGAKGIRLPIDGSDLTGIHTLNDLEDARQLKSALHNKANKTIAIIGGGYIGLEVAENLREMDKNVLIIERLPRLLNVFDPFVSDAALKILKDHQVDVYLNETVQAYQGDKKVTKIITDKGSYEADLVIEAVGVKPNTDFLAKTSIERLKNGAIVVNDKM